MTLVKADAELVSRYVLQAAAALEQARTSLANFGEPIPPSLVGKMDEYYAVAKTINPALP